MGKESAELLAYLDVLTLVTGDRSPDDAIWAMEAALAKARLVVNETRGTV